MYDVRSLWYDECNVWINVRLIKRCEVFVYNILDSYVMCDVCEGVVKLGDMWFWVMDIVGLEIIVGFESVLVRMVGIIVVVFWDC